MGEGGVLNSHIMLSLDRPKETMSHIIHGADVVYIKEERGGDWWRPLHSNRGQPMENAPAT